MGPETATEYRIFIDGIEFGGLASFKYNLKSLDGTFMWHLPASFKSTLKVKWENKIKAALGFTHYVKKGKLFRK